MTALKRNDSTAKTLNLKIGNKTRIFINVAKTITERKIGYSGHQPIGYNEGLLFEFEKAAIHPFWMKDMLFNLDFIFIKNNKIVDILENIPAPKNNQGVTEYVYSKKPFNKVLEVKGGFVDKYKVNIGDKVDY
jgi:uncharacterized membrane protein (UPF0127 family)